MGQPQKLFIQVLPGKPQFFLEIKTEFKLKVAEKILFLHYTFLNLKGGAI